MKVYTEVVYTWDDSKNELVEESSKSFDYKGEVTQCWGFSMPSPPRFTPPKLPKIKISVPKIPKIKKPAIVSSIQKAAAGGATQLKKNIHSATTTARSNVHGATTAGRTGLHEGTSAARAGVHVATDTARAFAHDVADKGKALWDQARGKGGDKPDEGQAGGSQKAMGSTADTKEKSGKFGSKGQLTTAKRKKSNTGKDKLKVRVV